jgi:hypothetical protein
MDRPPHPEPAALTRELTTALAILAGARRALVDHHLPELRHLIGALERIQATLGGIPAPERVGVRRQLLAVLDEAARLAESLGAEHARVQATLQRVGAKRQADRAYRRASRL